MAGIGQHSQDRAGEHLQQKSPRNRGLRPGAGIAIWQASEDMDGLATGNPAVAPMVDTVGMSQAQRETAYRRASGARELT